MWGAWGVERTQKRFKTSLTTKSCLMRWSMRILFVAIFALFRESTKRTELTYLGPSNCFILSFNNAIEPHRYNVGHSYLNIQGKTVWVKVFDFIRAKSCFPICGTKPLHQILTKLLVFVYFRLQEYKHNPNLSRDTKHNQPLYQGYTHIYIIYAYGYKDDQQDCIKVNISAIVAQASHTWKLIIKCQVDLLHQPV